MCWATSSSKFFYVPLYLSTQFYSKKETTPKETKKGRNLRQFCATCGQSLSHCLPFHCTISPLLVLPFFLSFSLHISLPLSFLLSTFLSLSLYVFFNLPFYPFLSFFLYLYLCLPFYPFLSLSLYLSLCFSFFLSLPFFLSLSFSFSAFLFVSAFYYILSPPCLPLYVKTLTTLIVGVHEEK